MSGDPEVPLHTTYTTLQINGHSILAQPNLKIRIDGNAKSIIAIILILLQWQIKYGTSVAILKNDAMIFSVETGGTYLSN